MGSSRDAQLQPAHGWGWVPEGVPALSVRAQIRAANQAINQDGAPCATEAPPRRNAFENKKNHKSSKPYFLGLLQCGGQGRGEKEVKSCESLVKEKCHRSSGIRILARLLSRGGGQP